MVDTDREAEDAEQAPAGEARPCDVPVRPGSQNYAAASKRGQEDEWIDSMASRYGGDDW